MTIMIFSRWTIHISHNQKIGYLTSSEVMQFHTLYYWNFKWVSTNPKLTDTTDRAFKYQPKNLRSLNSIMSISILIDVTHLSQDHLFNISITQCIIRWTTGFYDIFSLYGIFFCQHQHWTLSLDLWSHCFSLFVFFITFHLFHLLFIIFVICGLKHNNITLKMRRIK